MAIMAEEKMVVGVQRINFPKLLGCPPPAGDFILECQEAMAKLSEATEKRQEGLGPLGNATPLFRVKSVKKKWNTSQA